LPKLKGGDAAEKTRKALKAGNSPQHAAGRGLDALLDAEPSQTVIKAELCREITLELIPLD
jgi:hypothetical protein